MSEKELKDLLEAAVDAAFRASVEILDVYGSAFAVEHKDDRSPLTEADRRAHTEIAAVLAKTGIPILSEEGKEIPIAERQAWGSFWMVDPLDGTKEFVKRNGEFTVNIALIEKERPILGVIHVPVKDQLFFAWQGGGAYLLEKAGTFKGMHAYELPSVAKRLPMSNDQRAYRVVASRSHMSPETEAFVAEMKAEHGEVEIVSMGSALKICLVAQGEADVYPRYAPTMEWDTAAGHAIALEAGRDVFDYSTGKSMRYNKDVLVNNWFTVK